MKAGTFDPTKLDRIIEVLDSLRQHRVEHPRDKSDELYYELLVNYYRGIVDAKQQGRLVVDVKPFVPTEIFYAMDVVPSVAEPITGTMITLGNLWEESLASAKAFGISSSVCSMHRHSTAVALNGWLPRPDAVIWSSMYCDDEVGAGNLVARLWAAPSYFLDRGYDANKRDLAYFVRELEAMIAFLENLTGRKMDWDRLAQAMDYSRQLMALQREVEDLRKAVPSPLRSRAGMYMHLLGMYLAGAPEGVTFFRQLRDEARTRVASGEGAIKEERYRLLMFYEIPVYAWKLLDWMERAHGAVIVFEPIWGQWGPGDIDPSKPLESLAYKTFIRPALRQQVGRVEPLVEDMVRAAKEYSVDGVITFCHVGCRQNSSCNRLVKDAIVEETGLPFLTVEDDIADPAFVSEEEMRDKIEGFFEMIDERRR